VAGKVAVKATMRSRVDAYLKQRRTLGYRLRIEGQMLLNFARYTDRSGHCGPLTRELALRWAALPKTASRLYQARRLEVVRVFAQHQVAVESATAIPPRHVFGPAHRRQTPHIYNATQIHQLLSRSSRLPGQLRAFTYKTLLGLLACSGLRISEALALGVGEVDLSQGNILVRESKYHHSRWVPLHPTALASLQRYDRRRRIMFPNAQHFFVSDRGRRFAYTTVRMVFRDLTRGLKSNGARPLVRLHDLRHTFACRVLLHWQHGSRGAAGRMTILSRYLGHSRVSDTYWYLTATADLLNEAARHCPSR
jgi:integrase